MRTQHRIAAHAKYDARHSMASVHVLAANTEQPRENADRIMVLLRLAFEKLKIGTGDQEQFNCLAAATNVGLIRAEMIDPLAAETMVRGIQALKNCSDINDRHGKFGFSGPDLVCIADALELYDGILRLSTPRQMMEALDIVADRIKKRLCGITCGKLHDELQS